jgi:hypothetical protein
LTGFKTVTEKVPAAPGGLLSIARPALPLLVLAVGCGLYLSTLAPGIVFGDPTEYTLVPHVWGILHPPGYAFMTLLVKAWQTLVPIGTLAYRTNLLAAAAGVTGAMMVYGAVRNLTPLPGSLREGQGVGGEAAALLAALSLLTASNYWQHAIHTNAHIVTAMLASLAIYLLLRWRSTGRDGWLWAFGVVAGLSVTHHPLLVFGFPAYAIFIVCGRPRWQSLLILAGFGLLGLGPWLYFPIRSLIQPAPLFGPHDMNTLDGFLNLVLARGLTGVNLFHFGPAEQLHRLIVFWSLIRLQYAWPLVVLAGLGLLWLARRDPRAALLLGLHLFANLAFTLNSVQDVMAYLLVPLVSIAICIGAGALALAEWAARAARFLGRRSPAPSPWRARLASLPGASFAKHPEPPEGRASGHSLAHPTPPLRGVGGDRGHAGAVETRLPGASWAAGLSLALLIFPLASMVWLQPRISLRDRRDADAFVQSVVTHFDRKEMGALLLSDWEHATAWWYGQYVDQIRLDPSDVRLVYVNKPFVDAVWENIDSGPIYLIEYVPSVVNTGFRLRAEGGFYRLEPPPASSMPSIAHRTDLAFGPVELLGYDLLNPRVRAGDSAAVILYLRAPETTGQLIHPFARLGDREYRFTTDSHLLSADWQAGEVIAERWEITTPLDMPPGSYALEVGFSDLLTGEDFDPRVSLGSVTVEARDQAWEKGSRLTANFGQRAGVDRVEAWTGAGGGAQQAPWAEPLAVRPGQPIELRVHWRALAAPENSYTVFVHLLTVDNQLVASQDYTPLGGAWPTMLWFPKWLPGQTAVDPYTIQVPADAPAGDYYLEIGLYHLRSVVRVPAFDGQGSLAGDRFVLGGVTVVP